jgi:hypothetical protein
MTFSVLMSYLLWLESRGTMGGILCHGGFLLSMRSVHRCDSVDSLLKFKLDSLLFQSKAFRLQGSISFLILYRQLLVLELLSISVGRW